MPHDARRAAPGVPRSAGAVPDPRPGRPDAVGTRLPLASLLLPLRLPLPQRMAGGIGAGPPVRGDRRRSAVGTAVPPVPAGGSCGFVDQPHPLAALVAASHRYRAGLATTGHAR